LLNATARVNTGYFSLADILGDCQNKFDQDKYSFLSLLENNINLDEFIPSSYRNHFYASIGRHRKYHLQAFLCINNFLYM